MSEIPPPADYVAVEVAGKATGIPARTLRHWIVTGKLPAIAGKRGKLVSMAEVEHLAALVGKPVGNAETSDGNPATFADEVAGNVAERLADTALVTDAARQQLAAIRDEWLAPMLAQVTEQAERIGRLEAKREELRRQLEAAEREHDELRSQALPQPPSEATTGDGAQILPTLLRPLRASGGGCGERSVGGDE